MSKDAAEFIRTNTKVETKADGTTVASMTQKDFLGFMGGRGLEREQIDAMVGAHTDLLNGSILVAGDHLADALKKATDAGESTKGLTAEVRIARPDGVLKTEVHGHETRRNPKTEEPIDTYGRVKIRHNTDRLIDADVTSSVSAKIKGLLT